MIFRLSHSKVFLFSIILAFPLILIYWPAYCPWSHGLRQKSFKLMRWCYKLLSGFLGKDRLPRVSCQSLFTGLIYGSSQSDILYYLVYDELKVLNSINNYLIN